MFQTSIFKPLFMLFALALLVVSCILVINTIQFSEGTPDPIIHVSDEHASWYSKIESISLKKALARLSTSISFKTISRRGNPDSSASEFESLISYLKENYPFTFNNLEVSTFNNYSLLFKWTATAPSKKPILLLSHSDVVAAQSNDLWDFPPFSGLISDNKIWGRGTLDNKGTMIAIFETIEALLQSGYQPNRDIYFAVGHDEEIGGDYGAVAICKHLEELDIEFDFIVDEGGYFGEGIIDGVNKKAALIGIAEKGYVSLELSVESTGGHSSKPPTITSTGRLMKAITKVLNKPFDTNLKYTAMFLKHLGTDLPFSQRLVMANQSLLPPLPNSLLPKQPELRAQTQTTMAPTMLRGSETDNVIPTNPSAVINFRIIPGETIHSVIEEVADRINDPNVLIKIFGKATEPPKISSTDHFGYRVIADTAQQVTGKDVYVAPMLMIATTDSRHYQKLTNNIYRFTGLSLNKSNIKTFHGINEHVSVDSFEESIRFYGRLIINSTLK